MKLQFFQMVTTLALLPWSSICSQQSNSAVYSSISLEIGDSSDRTVFNRCGINAAGEVYLAKIEKDQDAGVFCFLRTTGLEEDGIDFASMVGKRLDPQYRERLIALGSLQSAYQYSEESTHPDTQGTSIGNRFDGWYFRIVGSNLIIVTYTINVRRDQDGVQHVSRVRISKECVHAPTAVIDMLSAAKEQKKK